MGLSRLAEIEEGEPAAAYFASKWVQTGRLIAGRKRGGCGKFQKRLLNAFFLSPCVIISAAETFHRLGRL